MRRRWRELKVWARKPVSEGASDGLSKAVASLLAFSLLGVGIGVVLLVQLATGWQGDPFCDVRVVKAICTDDSVQPGDASGTAPESPTATTATPPIASAAAAHTPTAVPPPTDTPTPSPTPTATPIPPPSVTTTFFGVTGGGPNQAPVLKALFQTQASEEFLVSSVVFEIEALPITLDQCIVFAAPVPTFEDAIEVSPGQPGAPEPTDAAVSLEIEPGDKGFEHIWTLVRSPSAKATPPILLVHVTLLVPDIPEPVEVGWAVLVFAEVGSRCQTYDTTAYDRLQQLLAERGVPETVRISDVVEDKLGH